MRKTKRKMIFLLAGTAVLFPAGGAQAKIQTEAMEYRQGTAVLEGYLAYDGAKEGQRPGVLVVHEWKGLNDYAKRRARQLAELGYIAFAADLYGKGVLAKDHPEAAALSGALRNDRKRMRERVKAGFEVLKQYPLTDPKRLAAVGYCFGGMAALELARSGEELKGVVTFHGALSNPHPEDAKNIKARVLVLHGAEDPNVPAQEVAAFEQEMKAAGAVHSFTVPEAGNDPSKGVAYNAQADKESWDEMKRFLEGIFQGNNL